MDGITFLGELRKIQPDSACILISPSPDMNALTQAVNEAHVDSFLHISWLNYELKADAMRRSWNLYQLSAAVLQALMTRSLVLENRRLAEIMRE
jgi:response regulator RpfG family c-di-GMP phosphodiesterase